MIVRDANGKVLRRRLPLAALQALDIKPGPQPAFMAMVDDIAAFGTGGVLITSEGMRHVPLREILDLRALAPLPLEEQQRRHAERSGRILRGEHPTYVPAGRV